MDITTIISSFLLVAEGLDVEAWAHPDGGNHKSHPRTGLLQEKVLVPGLQTSSLSHTLEPHLSGRFPFWPLPCMWNPQKRHSLSFSSYKKLHSNYIQRNTVQNTKEITSNLKNKFFLAWLFILSHERMSTLPSTQHLHAWEEKLLATPSEITSTPTVTYLNSKFKIFI